MGKDEEDPFDRFTDEQLSAFAMSFATQAYEAEVANGLFLDDQQGTMVAGMTDEEMKTISEAITVLHKRYGGTKWEIEVGPVSMYDPDDFRPFREVKINGQVITKLPDAAKS